MWQIVINGPGYFDTTYEIPQGITQLGRADENDIVLSGDMVSRKHAKIHLKGKVLLAEDLGSRNGCSLNGQTFKGLSPLKVGDVLTVGENSISVRQAQQSEVLSTDVLEKKNEGGIKRFGKGVDIREAVLFAKDVSENTLFSALDNVKPFEDSADILSKTARDSGEGSAPLAWQSLTLLYRVAASLAKSSTANEFFEEVLDLVVQRARATTGVILMRHESGLLQPVAVRHGSKLAQGEVPVSDAIVEAALKGQAIAVSNVRDDRRFSDRESVMLYNVDQVLCIPIGAQAPFSGVLYLNRDAENEEPFESLLDVCTAVSQLVVSSAARFAHKDEAPLRTKHTYERFFNPETASRLVSENTNEKAHLEEKTVTVLSVDVAWPTTKVPIEKLRDNLSRFSVMSAQLVFSFGGALARLSGDRLVAIFGASENRGDESIRAVRCALALKKEWAANQKSQILELKLALHTGKASVGMLGNNARFDFAAMGEAVLVSSNLCPMAEPAQLLMTGKTLASVGARFDVTPLGERAVAGTKFKFALFEVLDEDDDTGTLSGIRRPVVKKPKS
jgi:adenylate cyclase